MALSVMKGVAFTDKRLAKWLAEDGGVCIQPKRDEIRCIVTVTRSGLDASEPARVSYTSASGKPLYNLGCFDSMWRNVYAEHKQQQITYDCGCLVDDSFDVTRSVLRSSKKVYDLSNRAVFWLYDLPDVDLDFDLRIAAMSYISALTFHGGAIRQPETFYARTKEGVISAYEDYLAKGLEGLMVKKMRHRYKVGRSTDWMKLKPDDEVDCKVTGFEPGKGKYAGLIGSLLAVDAEGQQLSFSGFTDQDRRLFTENIDELIGRIAEVRYMQRDSQGGYRHPRFFRWHPDKVEL